MSAYIVSKEHVRFLLTAAIQLGNKGNNLHWSWVEFTSGTYKHGELRPGDEAEITRIGQLLWKENIKSVGYRYPNEAPDLLPAVDEDEETFEYGPHVYDVRVAKPVEILKAIHCLEYQSCEHPGWKDSEAHAFLRALEKRAMVELPGYGSAPWGYPEPYRALKDLAR